MAIFEPHSFFIAGLEELGLPYCVTGSVASGIYGESRFMLAATPELDQTFIDAQVARLGLHAQWRIVLEPGEPRLPAR